MAAPRPLLDAQVDAAGATEEFDAAFVRAVLEHPGLLSRPTDAQYADALAQLAAYRAQCQDNPRGEEWSPLPQLDADRCGELLGKAFIMFGAVQPSPAQLHKVYTAPLEPTLCETCG